MDPRTSKQLIRSLSEEVCTHIHLRCLVQLLECAELSLVYSRSLRLLRWLLLLLLHEKLVVLHTVHAQVVLQDMILI